VHRRNLSAQELDRATRSADAFSISLLCQEPASDTHKAQAQLHEHGHRREGPGDRHVEGLPQPWIVARLLRTPRYNLDAWQSEGGARMDQESGFVLVRLDQGQFEIGTHDLEWKARQACARANVHHRSSVAEVLDKDQAVLDKTWVGPGDEPGPIRDHPCELKQLRIVHEMPIYEYRCESCSGKFDVLTRFAERDQAQVCPACESTKTRVLVSSFAFAGTGESSQALDFGSGESTGGGCCGGSCGSCGSSSN
jgi:putative FmdB family regulatory protein